MNKLAISLSVCALAALGKNTAAQEIVHHPVSFGAMLDYGQVVKGRFSEQPGPDSIADGQVITRTLFYLSEGGSYGNLDVRVTIAGLLWSVLPENRTEFEKRIVYPGAGIGEAKAKYSFGGTENPWADLSLGYFPIKYNPDSKDLGEYLYRSGTYPGVIYTGGWSLMNSSAYFAQGARFHFPTFGGKLTHDFTLTMERDPEPLYDFSPGYVFTWKPVSHFEIGGGLIWAHGIPFQPDSVLTPRSPKNAYDTRNNRPLLYNNVVTGETGKPHYRTGDTAIVPAGDPRATTPMPGRPGKNYVTAEGNGVPGEFLDYYTYKGFKTMARASLDLGGLFGMDEAIGEGAFKLYGEWAWLGIQNQPYFYDMASERMPIMVGLNIPTFRALDMLGVEVEYRKSRFPDNYFAGFYDQQPIPSDGVTDVSAYDKDAAGFAEREKDFDKDNLKWSIYAKRTLRKGLTVHAQAASDHIRFVTTEGGGKFRPTWSPSTQEPGQWYYLLRLEFGI
jgi:hypothetical protein